MALDWNRFNTLAASVARRIADEYPGIDADDIQQEILLKALENKDTLEKADYPEGQIRKNFRQWGIGYAGRERYAFIYHSAEYIYTNAEVRQLFEKAFFRPELWEAVPSKDDGISVTAGGVVVALWDLNNAYDALSADDATVIAKRYEQESTLSSAEAMRLSRAIDKVTRALNNGVIKKQNEAKAYDGPGIKRPAA
jgi:DNA-directed RNA polymerase specialized sigma24 family protein